MNKNVKMYDVIDCREFFWNKISGGNPNTNNIKEYMWDTINGGSLELSDRYIGGETTIQIPEKATKTVSDKYTEFEYVDTKPLTEETFTISKYDLSVKVILSNDLERRRRGFIHPFLTEAINTICPEYLDLTEKQQDEFKLDRKNDDIYIKICDRVEESVRSGFLSSDMVRSNSDEFEELTDDEKRHIYSIENKITLETNKITLAYIGVGDKCFMLNEYGHDDSVAKNHTLYEYNKTDHEFQESHSPEDERKELYPRLSFWARTYTDDGFRYISGMSLPDYIGFKLEDVVEKWFDVNIPYDFAIGPHHGEKCTDDEGNHVGTRWDMVVSANGLEREYDIIRRFSYKKMAELVQTLYKTDYDCVFVMETKIHDDLPYKDDPHCDYVFGSLNVLHNIRFNTFYDDCMNLKADSNNDLLAIVDEMSYNMIESLDSEFKRISPFNYYKFKILKLFRG